MTQANDSIRFDSDLNIVLQRENDNVCGKLLSFNLYFASLSEFLTILFRIGLIYLSNKLIII
jgi:hypothetical protein